MASGTLSPHNSFRVWAPVSYVPHLPPTLILSASVCLFFARTTAVPSTGHHWDLHGKKDDPRFSAVYGNDRTTMPYFSISRLSPPLSSIMCPCSSPLSLPEGSCLSQFSSWDFVLSWIGRKKEKIVLYMQVKFQRSFLGNFWEVFGKLALWATQMGNNNNKNVLIPLTGIWEM